MLPCDRFPPPPPPIARKTSNRESPPFNPLCFQTESPPRPTSMSYSSFSSTGKLCTTTTPPPPPPPPPTHPPPFDPPDPPPATTNTSTTPDFDTINFAPEPGVSNTWIRCPATTDVLSPPSTLAEEYEDCFVVSTTIGGLYDSSKSYCEGFTVRVFAVEASDVEASCVEASCVEASCVEASCVEASCVEASCVEASCVEAPDATSCLFFISLTSSTMRLTSLSMDARRPPVPLNVFMAEILADSIQLPLTHSLPVLILLSFMSHAGDVIRRRSGFMWEQLKF